MYPNRRFALVFLQEQRDELARLIQKARCSPNMNEWHHQQAQTLNNNKENSHLQKTKNLKRLE